MPSKVIPAPPPPPPPDSASKPTVEVGVPGAALPPPGYSREEELKRRQDALDEYLARRSDQLGIEAMDPNKLRPDHEILCVMDQAMLIENRQPGWEYAWVPRAVKGLSQLPEFEIMLKKMQGWIFVEGSDPECPHLKQGAAGERYFGDTVLMKIPTIRYEALQAEDQIRAQRAREGVDAALREVGEKYRSAGVVVTDREDVRFDRMQQITGAAAEQIAGRKMDDLIRSGSVPGMRVRS